MKIGEFNGKVCEAEGCNNPARYALYKTYPEGKKWIYVCKKHEGLIGNENMKRAKKLQR